jgi:aryl-alcohol dehydrogenase-like predicted oxidoreductase
VSIIATSDLEIFPVALGGNSFGWTSDEATSHSVLDAAPDVLKQFELDA